MSDYDPSDEYTLMGQAGMSFRQILASLTTAPAERFRESKQRGRIATGLAADLVVLADDPSKNVTGICNRAIHIAGGEADLFEQEKLPAPTPRSCNPSPISDEPSGYRAMSIPSMIMASAGPACHFH